MIDIFLDKFHAYNHKNQGGASKPTQPQKRLNEIVTSFACEILRVYHALKEFSDIYENHNLPCEFNENIHEHTPHFSKMQQGFNSLKKRAEVLNTIDPRITELFNIMVDVSIIGDQDGSRLATIESCIYDLIGRERILDTGVFSQYGIICLKGELPPSSKPENVVTQLELEDMNKLKNDLLDSKKCRIGIFDNGDKLFTQSVKNDLEKLLTFPEGRMLFTNLVERTKGRVVNISKGVKDGFYWKLNQIMIKDKHSLRYGYCASKNLEIGGVMIPKYITLAHELIHLQHILNGEYETSQSCRERSLWTNSEEYKTIGDPRRELPIISENSFISHTFHQQRIFHASPRALPFKEYIQDVKLEQKGTSFGSKAAKSVENEVRAFLAL